MGSWVLYLNITTILEVVRNGLVKSATVKFFNSSLKEDQSKIKSASLIINAVFTSLTLAILLTSATWISSLLSTPQLVPMFYRYSLVAVFFVPFSHLEFIQQSNMKFKGIFYSYFSKQGVFFVLITLMALFSPDNFSVIDLVLLQAVGLFIGSIVSYLNCRQFLTYTFDISKSWLLKLWHFGKYGMFTNLSNSALTTTDHLLIGGIVSTPSVAIYNAAFRITNLFVIPSVAIADILLPKTVEAHEAQGTEKVKMLYEKAVGATLVPMIPILVLVLLFPETIIRVIAGERYLESASILKISIFGILILPFLKQFGTVVNSIDKPQYNFYFVLVLSCFNLLLNYICITNFGIIGAAYATLATYFIGFIASQLILRQLIESSVVGIIRHMVAFYQQIPLKIRNSI